MTKESVTQSNALDSGLLARLARFPATDLERFADYGPSGFNTLIGGTVGQTLDNIEPVIEFLHAATEPDRGISSDDMMRGLNSVILMIWMTVQCERDRLLAQDEQEGGVA